MAFQGVITPRGHIEQLAEIEGSKIVGTKINAPFSINPQVYVLPMDNVLATKVLVESNHPPLNIMFTLKLGHWCSHLRPLRLARRLPNPHRPAQEARILQDRSLVGRHRPRSRHLHTNIWRYDRTCGS